MLSAGISQGHQDQPMRDGLSAHGGGLHVVLCAAQTCSVIVDSKDVVGHRRRRRAARAQASPTRPEQPSLALVGGGWSLVPRSRTLEQPTLLGRPPIFFNHLLMLSRMSI